jgi:hypothetical protein
VAIYGRGEAAELAYLSLKESGLEPVAVFDAESNGNFLGMHVRDIAEHTQVEYDLIIVATLEKSGQLLTALMQKGVPREKLFPLRREPDSKPQPRRARQASERARSASDNNGEQD